MMELTSMLHSVPPPHSDTDIHGMTVTEWGGPPDSWTGTEKPGARSSRLSVFIAPPDVTLKHPSQADPAVPTFVFGKNVDTSEEIRKCGHQINVLCVLRAVENR